jgi:hypothetical protein
VIDVDVILADILDLKKSQFEDQGVTVVRERYNGEPTGEMGAGSEVLGDALRQIIEDAFDDLKKSNEHRLTVRTRNSPRGSQIEVEYCGGKAPEMGPEPCLDQDDELIEHASHYKEILRDCGARVFLKVPNKGKALFLIEVPQEPSLAS